MVFFRYYLHDNLVNPNENSKIQDNTKLNKKTVETLLNELFALDEQDTNEQKMLEYADIIAVNFI